MTDIDYSNDKVSDSCNSNVAENSCGTLQSQLLYLTTTVPFSELRYTSLYYFHMAPNMLRTAAFLLNSQQFLHRQFTVVFCLLVQALQVVFNHMPVSKTTPEWMELYMQQDHMLENATEQRSVGCLGCFL